MKRGKNVEEVFKNLEAWLKDHAFEVCPNPLKGVENKIGWIACRRVDRENVRPCETNDRVQVVVEPNWVQMGEHEYVRCSVSLTGEAHGVWWRLEGYSFSPEELPTKVDWLENNLVAAWNVLRAE